MAREFSDVNDFAVVSVRCFNGTSKMRAGYTRQQIPVVKMVRQLCEAITAHLGPAYVELSLTESKVEELVNMAYY